MIIRVSFYDNDFQELLESQFRYGLSTPFLTVRSQYSNSDNVEDQEEYKRITILQDLILHKLNMDKKLTLKEKEELINIIKDAYKVEIESKYGNKKYLLQSLEVKIIPSYKDKWENGEMLYYFSTPDTYIIE